MKNLKLTAVASLIIFYITMIVTWFANIFQLIFFTDVGFTVVVVLKIVGIFVPPVGMVLGFLGFFGI